MCLSAIHPHTRELHVGTVVGIARLATDVRTGHVVDGVFYNVQFDFSELGVQKISDLNIAVSPVIMLRGVSRGLLTPRVVNVDDNGKEVTSGARELHKHQSQSAAPPSTISYG